jgi:hypothetical protein
VSPSARTSRVLWTIIAAVAALWLFLVVVSTVQAVQAGNWPTANGRILQSKYAQGCGRGGNQPFPDVRYTYEFEGTVYTGRRIALDTAHCGWASTARRVAETYKPGQAVKVFINPRKPHESALVAGDAQPETMAILVASVAGLALASFKLTRGRGTRRAA